jgi:hypothetical protein
MILHNFATSRSILAALDSSTISRLQHTWMVRFNFYFILFYFILFWSIVILCMISFDSVGCAAEAKVAARQCSKARRSCSKLSRVSLTLARDGPSRCSVFRCVLWTAASIFLLIYHNQAYISLMSLSVERGIHLIGRLPWLLRRS